MDSWAKLQPIFFKLANFHKGSGNIGTSQLKIYEGPDFSILSDTISYTLLSASIPLAVYQIEHLACKNLL